MQIVAQCFNERGEVVDSLHWFTDPNQMNDAQRAFVQKVKENNAQVVRILIDMAI